MMTSDLLMFPMHQRGQLNCTDNSRCNQNWGTQICSCGAEGYKPWNSVCAGIDLGGDQICPSVSGDWHKSIVSENFDANLVCFIAAHTVGQTCKQYCEAKGRPCMMAQDNTGQCGIVSEWDDYTIQNQDLSGNGCTARARPPPVKQFDPWYSSVIPVPSLVTLVISLCPQCIRGAS
jgi:hypothetical protein